MISFENEPLVIRNVPQLPISDGFPPGPVPGQSTGSFIPQDWHVLAGSHLGPVSSMGELVVDRDWTVHLNAAPKDGRKLPHRHMFINGQQVFPARFGPNRLLYMPATFALTGTTSQMLRRFLRVLRRKSDCFLLKCFRMFTEFFFIEICLQKLHLKCVC